MGLVGRAGLCCEQWKKTFRGAARWMCSGLSCPVRAHSLPLPSLRASPSSNPCPIIPGFPGFFFSFPFSFSSPICFFALPSRLLASLLYPSQSKPTPIHLSAFKRSGSVSLYAFISLPFSSSLSLRYEYHILHPSCSCIYYLSAPAPRYLDLCRPLHFTSHLDVLSLSLS